MSPTSTSPVVGPTSPTVVTVSSTPSLSSVATSTLPVPVLPVSSFTTASLSSGVLPPMSSWPSLVSLAGGPILPSSLPYVPPGTPPLPHGGYSGPHVTSTPSWPSVVTSVGGLTPSSSRPYVSPGLLAAGSDAPPIWRCCSSGSWDLAPLV